MASKTYTIGQYTYRREVKQGAPAKPPELRREHIVHVRMNDAAYTTFCSAWEKTSMSASAFAELMIGTGIIHLFDSDNCSKT